MKQDSADRERDDFRMEDMRAVVHSLRVQWALQDVLQAAKAQNQLILGVHRAAEELATDRGHIGLCVLVDNPHTDPGVHVHCRLIEAFCWESFIPVIKVDSSEKLKELLGSRKDTVYCVFVKEDIQPSESLETVVKFSRHIPIPLLKITK